MTSMHDPAHQGARWEDKVEEIERQRTVAYRAGILRGMLTMAVIILVPMLVLLVLHD